MSDDDGTQINLIRTVALEEIETLREARKLLSEQHSQSYRWLLASLLAINSGAIVATLNSNAIDPTCKVQAGGVFACGIIFTMLNAYAGQKLNATLIPHIQKRIGYWLGVAEDGNLDQEQDEALVRDTRKTLRRRHLPEFFGWLSALCFLVGLGFLGGSLIKEPQAASFSVNKLASTEATADDH